MLDADDRAWILAAIRTPFERLERKLDTYSNADEVEDRRERRAEIAVLKDWKDLLSERLEPVDVLPASAPLGALLRKKGPPFDPVLYLGNGPGRPLTKIVPQPL